MDSFSHVIHRKAPFLFPCITPFPGFSLPTSFISTIRSKSAGFFLTKSCINSSLSSIRSNRTLIRFAYHIFFGENLTKCIQKYSLLDSILVFNLFFKAIAKVFGLLKLSQVGWNRLNKVRFWVEKIPEGPSHCTFLNYSPVSEPR